jgi:hypothetical protein
MSLSDNALSVLLMQQSLCWRQGQQLPVEEFLALELNLDVDENTVLCLLCHEVLLRQALGQSPDLNEYIKRFPKLAEKLRDHFEIPDDVHSNKLLDQCAPTTSRFRVLRPHAQGGLGKVSVAGMSNSSAKWP